MKTILGLWALVVVLGCSSSSIEKRRAEKSAAYTSLNPEFRELVDQGQIKVGMPQDAVYIAWGKPEEILQSESTGGRQEVWLYHGSWLEKRRYWSYRESIYGGRPYLERYIDHDYDPRTYVSAEIVFADGVVKSWRTLPRPVL